MRTLDIIKYIRKQEPNVAFDLGRPSDGNVYHERYSLTYLGQEKTIQATFTTPKKELCIWVKTLESDEQDAPEVEKEETPVLTWEDRLILERSELTEKVNGLTNFLRSYSEEGEHFNLLKFQLEAMQVYLQILDSRFELLQKKNEE